ASTAARLPAPAYPDRRSRSLATRLLRKPPWPFLLFADTKARRRLRRAPATRARPAGSIHPNRAPAATCPEAKPAPDRRSVLEWSPSTTSHPPISAVRPPRPRVTTHPTSIRF